MFNVNLELIFYKLSICIPGLFSIGLCNFLIFFLDFLCIYRGSLYIFHVYFLLI